MTSRAYPFLKPYLIFLLCSLSQLLQTHATVGNETDFRSLIAFKDRVQGLSSWNQSFHFCRWEGITCSKHHQRVVTLNLSSHKLVGSLSPHIGNLSFLRFINLENNTFYGEIPQEIGQLFRLRSLKMSNNSFGGEFPANLTRCTNLRVIDFRWNKLSGKLPAKIGSLSKLVVLAMFRNRLTGEFPPSFGNLSSLQVLSMGENNLEGSIPDTLGRLSNLSAFIVELNNLSGKVPLSLYNISSIKYISITNNQFTGSLPRDMGTTLPNLVEFFASANQLSGLLPISLANASKIEVFDVYTNNFTGQVPRNLGALQNLYWLNLGTNYLESGEADDLSFITSLTNASSLRTLSLSYNALRGVIPNSISNLSTQMEYMYLGENQLSGIIPKDIRNLANLIGLGLESNYLHGNIPSSIGYLQELQLLTLGGNRFTGLIPSSMANATQLSQLDLSTNRLEGRIPSSLGGLRFMQTLDISRNNLSGTIPKEIFGLSSLSLVLDISRNSFTGSLPVEVGNLKTLGRMDVSGNKLSGNIPSTLANCLSLEELHLENNLFEGTIPESFGSLKSIRYLDLSNNNLSGQIPIYFENFSYLQRLNLSFNKLEGVVPIKGIFKNASVISVAGNFKLCGGMRELQLPACQIRKPEKHGKEGMSVAFKLAIVISVSLLFLLASSFLILCWKRKPKLNSSSPLMENQHIIVSYRDLFVATRGFSPTNFLGSGSFGHVYKGELNQSGLLVAVKVFNLKHKGSSKSFVAECEALRNIRHRNLVKILTSCSSIDFEGNDFKALVFEFMQNGSLERWLYPDDAGQDAPSKNLNLTQRLNIAIDVASGLIYLHHECHISIVHRDLKPSNILLDNDMVGHLSDFGIAKLLLRPGENLDMNQITSTYLNGSIGYAAPEYGMGSAASIHADVYSYGILLLELFTGRRPTDEMFKDGLSLRTYAREALSNQVAQIVDPRLLSEEDGTIEDPHSIKDQSHRGSKLLDCVSAVIKIGVACSVESPAERMDTRDVNRELLSVRKTLRGF